MTHLTAFARGSLAASGHNGTGVLDTVCSAGRTQSWGLDALDNWNSVSTNGSAQSRTFNSQNQITAISGSTTPAYDNNGNTTTDDAGTTYKFDAWNRLVTVTLSGAGSAAEAYQYTAIGAERGSLSLIAAYPRHGS